MKKLFKAAACLITAFCIAVMALVAYSGIKLSDNYTVTNVDNIKVNLKFPVTYNTATQNLQPAEKSNVEKTNYNITFKLFGIFPIKDSAVTVSKEKSVAVLGTPFGIKFYTNGVLIVNITPFKSESGEVSPAQNSGLLSGDYITGINGKAVNSNQDVEKIIESTGGADLTVNYSRNGKDYVTVLKPIISKKDGNYHLGMWLRDSSAGIGTLTFYDPETSIIAGLGHGMCDSDTGKMISVNSGSMVKAEILSIVRSTNGCAGELMGRFVNTEYSNVLLNSETGVYAKATESFNSAKYYRVGLKQDIALGNAKVYTTINGEAPQLYDCKIIKIVSLSKSTRNFIVQITDKVLNAKTGGIVQGMSGSPILQNGKFVGALTHVFVDDCKKGYAIFAENMIITDKNFSSELEKAS